MRRVHIDFTDMPGLQHKAALSRGAIGGDETPDSAFRPVDMSAIRW